MPQALEQLPEAGGTPGVLPPPTVAAVDGRFRGYEALSRMGRVARFVRPHPGMGRGHTSTRDRLHRVAADLGQTDAAASATMAAIARVAGASKRIVSRALGGKPASAVTRQRVMGS